MCSETNLYHELRESAERLEQRVKRLHFKATKPLLIHVVKRKSIFFFISLSCMQESGCCQEAEEEEMCVGIIK